jgi:hypothetical protein
MDDQDRKSLTEACELLERKPRIEWEVNVAVHTGQQLSIKGWMTNMSKSAESLLRQTPFCFIDEVFDPDVWTRFGRAVRNSRALKTISLRRRDVINGDLPVAAARCIDAFFAEVKHNKSIAVAVPDQPLLLQLKFK